jgi:hopanoid-associated phosphorylase
MTGLQSEARCVSTHLGDQMILAVSGARRDGAEAAALRLIAAGATHLLSFGLAGGLDPSLEPGRVLLPHRIVTETGRVHPVDPEWHARLLKALAPLSPLGGTELSVDTPLATVAAKQAAWKRTGAAAVDMESHLLAATGLPVLVLRVICDPADAALPPAALVGVKPDGGTDLRAVLASLLRRPGQIPALARLARAAGIAERALLGCGGRAALAGFGMA